MTLFGLICDQNSLVDGLQRLGCMHLIPLVSQLEDGPSLSSQPGERAREALQHLMDVRRRRHQTCLD